MRALAEKADAPMKHCNGGHQRSSSPFEEKKLPLFIAASSLVRGQWRKTRQLGCSAAACPGTINTATAGHQFFVYDTAVDDRIRT
jgi:hypothetical protein